MKKISLFFFFTILISSLFYSCTTPKNATETSSKDHNIKIELRAIAGSDGIVRTEEGDTIGSIDSKGYIYNLAGVKIGEKKLTETELIKQVGF